MFLHVTIARDHTRDIVIGSSVVCVRLQVFADVSKHNEQKKIEKKGDCGCKLKEINK